jgi:hypothetical protein
MGRTVARTLTVAAAAITAAIVALSLAAACSGQRKPKAEPLAADFAGPPIDERLTPDIAARAFRSFVDNDDVARASGDERLALQWTEDGQAQLTAAQFRKAAFTGDPVPRYTYSDQKLYVPKFTDLEQYPKWFVVRADRAPRGAEGVKASGRRTTLMAFVRKSPESRWRLSVSALLDKKAKPPQVPVGKDGYATLLATFDVGLTIQPRIVPAMQATLAEEGPESLAAKVMRTGTHTTGFYTRDRHSEERYAEDGIAYDSVYAAAGFPIYQLRTEDGGALVLYALSRDTVTFVKDKKHSHLSIPRGAAHLLDTIVLKDELHVNETLQFATAVPAKPTGKNGAPGGDQDKDKNKASVIASDGAVVSAETTESD